MLDQLCHVVFQAAQVRPRPQPVGLPRLRKARRAHARRKAPRPAAKRKAADEDDTRLGDLLRELHDKLRQASNLVSGIERLTKDLPDKEAHDHATSVRRLLREAYDAQYAFETELDVQLSDPDTTIESIKAQLK
jgi:hypothetical protein